MIDPQKLFLPLGIGAAVITVYLLFRNENSQSQILYPNPASSGVSQAQTAGGAIQPVSYNVPPLTTSGPATIVSLGGPQEPGGYGPAYSIEKNGVPQDATLADPFSSNPGGQQRTKPPAYMAVNFQNFFRNMKAQPEPASGGCGGCSSKKSACDSCTSAVNGYGDGRGATALASSGMSQIQRANPTVFEDSAENINAYLALIHGDSALPTLASNPAAARL